MDDGVVNIRPRKVEPLKIGNQVFRSAYDLELTEKDLEKAARELGETEEKKRTCLRILKEKLSEDTDVKYCQDDLYLLRFLRVRKYDVKRACHNVKLFYADRRKYSGFFTVPQELKSAQEINFLRLLPYTNEEGTIMFWLSFNKWNMEEKTLEEIFQTVTTVCDIIAMNPHCHINGVIGIWDFNGLSMKHISEVLWNGRLWGLVSIFQSGYPWRIKKVIILNANRVFRILYSLIKPLLTRKLRERFFLLGSDVTELHQHVNPVILPESLNGSVKDEDCDISQHVLDNLPYLKYERSFS